MTREEAIEYVVDGLIEDIEEWLANDMDSLRDWLRGATRLASMPLYVIREAYGAYLPDEEEEEAKPIQANMICPSCKGTGADSYPKDASGLTKVCFRCGGAGRVRMEQTEGIYGESPATTILRRMRMGEQKQAEEARSMTNIEKRLAKANLGEISRVHMEMDQEDLEDDEQANHFVVKRR